jgi:R3H domain/RNA recognition motif. (a.k.a. RRM, RBD, or RNP domain)
MDQMAPYSGLGASSLGHGGLRPDHLAADLDEELIPTAIVIKNIPFAVKKEQLVQLMTEMGLPLPYAFNYHFDNGIFRGLAFANFTTADETAVVIEALNHYELLGRKLRVEYKKMLPLAERERIEREKRIKRGQLEEQHQPMRLHQQPSVGSMSSGPIPGTSPSPVSNQNHKLGTLDHPGAKPSYSLIEEIEYDLNDPTVLEFYTKLAVFKADPSRETMTMPPTLTPAQRRIVHTLAHKMGLAHVSKGEGERRSVHIFRVHGDGPNMSPPVPQMPTSHPADTHRRALNRAATTDFAEVRGDGFYGTLGRQSSGLLGFPDSPSGLTTHNLRAAKSYADLRSYTPSPVPSTASFPATLNTNFARFASEYAHGSTAASNPNLSATATSMASRDDSLLVNGMGNMNIGGGFGQGGSPRSLRNAWDREAPGPIGGHRAFSTAFDDQNRDRSQGLPSRQPRGPLLDRGTGFPTTRPRQNGHSGRGSDELSSQSGKEILVEQ